MAQTGTIRCIFTLVSAAVVLSGAAQTARAANVNAATCSQIDVQAAINTAGNGDTVTVPAGSCTWTAPVTITNRPLTLRGAGIDVTNITANVPNVAPLQITTCSASNFVMASGFTWRLQSAGSGYGIISIGCNNVAGYPPVAFRISQMKMYGDPTDGVSNGGRYIMVNAVYGVVDHSSFYSYTSRGAGNISMSTDNSVSTANSYHTPFTLGDNHALYVEDCDFYFGVANSGNGVVDNYSGARYVFRHNRVYNNNVGNHGWDSQPRGVPTFEIYENTFIAESGVGGISLFQPRSGTGVLWNNTVTNIQPMSGWQGYLSFFAPIYYGALTPYALGGNVNLNARAAGYYPSGPWGTIPYPGTAGPVTDGKNNYVTGSNPIDGNQTGPGHMDPDSTRTVTDLVTTVGSTTITSATANFVFTDRPKNLYATNITQGRVVTDGRWTGSSTTVTSNTVNFTAGDVGRLIGDTAATIPQGTTIASVISPTTAVMSAAARSIGTGVLVLGGPYIFSVTNPTTAVLNVPATASGLGGTLTIGYTDQGYPLADQPGRGAFPTGNPGNWPNVATGYSNANYEALAPIYLFGNRWQTTDAMLNVLTSGLPPATTVGLEGSQAYIKHLREWYDDPDTLSGTLAARPSTCTTGYAYWATDVGEWDSTHSGPDGQLYKCTSTKTWSLYYTPFTYPYPVTTPAGPAPPTNLRVIQ